MRIVTYTSSLMLPPTIFTSRTLLQNTQTRLSYTHVHFTNTTAVNLNCDLLAIDSSSLGEEDLEKIKVRYGKNIAWSCDIIDAVLWFMESFTRNPSKYYLVVGGSGEFEALERNEECASREEPEEEPGEEPGEECGDGARYLQSKFEELQEEDKAVQKIFSRLSLMHGRKR
jgi:hypothetical protein